jgi:hypothetical protein
LHPAKFNRIVFPDLTTENCIRSIIYGKEACYCEAFFAKPVFLGSQSQGVVKEIASSQRTLLAMTISITFIY